MVQAPDLAIRLPIRSAPSAFRCVRTCQELGNPVAAWFSDASADIERRSIDPLELPSLRSCQAAFRRMACSSRK